MYLLAVCFPTAFSGSLESEDIVVAFMATTGKRCVTGVVCFRGWMKISLKWA